MVIQEVLSAILSPNWLVRQISLMSTLLAGSFLVYFGNYVHGKIILPITDWTKDSLDNKLRTVEKVSFFSKYIAIFVSTIIFLLYVYFGAYFLADIIFQPIIWRLRQYLLLVAIGLFVLVAYAINNVFFRRRIMGS